MFRRAPFSDIYGMQNEYICDQPRLVLITLLLPSQPQEKALQQESMAWGGVFLSFSRPSQEQHKSCLAAAGGFNYDTALHGATRPKPAATLTAEAAETGDRALVERGFFVNRSRVLIGSGAATFLHAKSALLSWK